VSRGTLNLCSVNQYDSVTLLVEDDDSNVQDVVTSEDDLGITHVDGLGKKDLERVRSLALIDLTALFDMYGVTYVRRRAKGRGRGRYFGFLFTLCKLASVLSLHPSFFCHY